MAKITIHAGDFPKGGASTHFGVVTLPWQPGDGFTGEQVLLTELAEVEIATEESVKRLGGTLGWGAAGALIIGPVGLLAGLLFGGRKTEVTFAAKFKDGRKLLGTTDSKTYKAFLAAVFK